MSQYFSVEAANVNVVLGTSYNVSDLLVVTPGGADFGSNFDPVVAADAVIPASSQYTISGVAPYQGYYLIALYGDAGGTFFTRAGAGTITFLSTPASFSAEIDIVMFIDGQWLSNPGVMYWQEPLGGVSFTSSGSITISSADRNETTTISLAQDTGAHITTPASAGHTISFTDTNSTPSWSASLTNETVQATYQGHSVSLTAAQTSTLENALSLSPSSGSATNGSISWTYDPSGLFFLAEGETVQVNATVQVSDPTGGSDTANITVILSGPPPAPQLDEASRQIETLNTVMSSLATATGQALADDDIEEWFKGIEVARRATGIGISALTIGSELSSDLQAAGNDPLAQWAAYKKADVNFFDGLVKTAFTAAAASLANVVGTAVIGEALVATTTALFTGVGLTVGSPIILAAATAIGLGLGAAYVYDQYLSPVVKEHLNQEFIEAHPAPILINQEISGQLVHGYVSGATVFADANGNGILDPGESSTHTDASGNFDLFNGTGPLVLTGGIDTSTGLPFIGGLHAPSGSKIISPLTTVISALLDLGVTDAQTANQKVLAALGLSSGLSLLGLDPVGSTSAGESTSGAAMAASAEVFDTVKMISAALSGAGGPATGVQDVFSALALAINNLGSGQTLDLADAATLESIIASVAQAENVMLGASFVAHLASGIAASNSLIEQRLAADSPGEALLADIASIERIAEGAEAEAFNNAAGDDTVLQAALSNYTGSDLTALLALSLTELPIVASDNARLVLINDVASISDPASGVLAGAADPAGYMLSVTEISGSNGAGTIGHALTGTFGHLTLNPDGTYLYTADNAAGIPFKATESDVFTYTVSDGHGQSTTAKLIFEVANLPRSGVSLTTLTIGASGAVTLTGNSSSSVVGVQFTAGVSNSGPANIDSSGTWALQGVASAIDAIDVTATDIDNNTADAGLASLQKLAFGAANIAASLSATTIASTQFVIDGGNFGRDTLTITGQSVNLSNRTFLNWTSTDIVSIVGSPSNANTLTAAPVSTSMIGGSSSDIMLGGNANDSLYGGGGSDLLYGAAGNDLIDSGAGNDVIVAGAGDDSSYGGDGNDYIYAGAGNDVLMGGAGLDVLLGEDGNDVVYGGAGFNYLFGGSGTDTLIGSGGTSGSDVNVMYGESGADYLYGGQGTNYFYGGAGIDTMYGGSGLNIFISSGETDGNVIYGGSGQNYVYGSNGGDTVTGGGGVDVFLMGTGADQITGGGGVDYAWGGGGADTFSINDTTSEVMVIQDFNVGGVNDFLNFAGTSLHSFADVQAAETYAAGINTTIITDAAGNAAWLIGIAPAQLDAGMFKFS